MRVLTVLTTGAAVWATAAIGGLATAPAVQSDWYRRLRKPPYQPPRQVFPVVWPALYADIAVVSASTLDRLRETGDEDARRSYRAALAANLALNAAWSWLFFNRRRFASAAVLSAALTASSADLARRAIAVRGGGGVPLAAYPVWCAFATVLSGGIAVRNRDGAYRHAVE